MSFHSFVCPRADKIVSGPGAIKALPEIMAQAGVAKAFVLTTQSLVKNGALEKVKAILGKACVGAFTSSEAHNPTHAVLGAVEAVKGAGADVLIGLGGSSVVDLAKATAMTLAEGGDWENMKISYSPEEGRKIVPLPAPKMPQIAVPTTLSASEFTFVTAITDTESGEKNLYFDPKLAPRFVIQDGALAAETPDGLWITTGMKLFSDCVENLCSPRGGPFTDAVALAGLDVLNANLEASKDASNIGARQACFQAGYMGLGFATNAGVGMVAALRHQLGGNLGVPHGVASTIVLPHVLRFNRPEITGPLARIARALGVDSGDEDANVDAAIEAIVQLIDNLGVPARLRDAGVQEGSFQSIAEHAARDIAMSSNPRIATAAEIAGVLKAAW